MLTETGRSIGHFKDTSIAKGKKALNLSRRAAIPLGILWIAYGTISGAIHLREDKESRDSINAHVRETYPRGISEEEYKLAQRETSDFDRNKSSYINPDSLPIAIPQYVPEHNQLIEEDVRSQNASQLKNQLTDEYDAKHKNRGKKDSAILAFSFVVLLALLFNKKRVDANKNRRANATSPEPADP